MQLVEDAVDGSWIGYRARSAIVDECEIGSVYSPPKDISGLAMPRSSTYVETVIDIGYRREVSLFLSFINLSLKLGDV